MSHPTFEVDLWRTRLVANARGEIGQTQRIGHLRAPSDSPISILVGEYYRKMALTSGRKLGRKIPVDQFTFGRGEPRERYLTKLHGLPYRPRNLSWPTDESGRPLTFLAQFSFVDSSDHMNGLPGDVLLIFIRNFKEPPYPGIWLEFEWHRLGIEDLIMETPAPELPFPTCYGVRHRTWDFPNESLAMPVFQSLVDARKISSDASYLAQCVRAMAIYPGMKIGGSPYWFEPSKISSEHRNRGTFLCAFNGLSVVSDTPYPFVNQPEPLDIQQTLSDENKICFYNGLILNFYLNNDGSVGYDAQVPLQQAGMFFPAEERKPNLKVKPHPHYDLREWRKRLLPNRDGKIDETEAQTMDGLFTGSPSALLGIEYYRRLAKAKGLDLGPSVPVDQFIFGKGEPPERHLTKIHGLPYRPKTLKWPVDEFGEPLTFLMQYSFVDSRDHMGSLPGDVLLIFIKNMYVHGCLRFEFEWQNLGIDDLVMTTPKPALEFPTCYAVRHRSCDYSDESMAVDALKRLIKRTPYMDEKPWVEKEVLRALACYPGMKIGGLPYWNDPSGLPEDFETAGRFLGAFNGVSVAFDSPYPFANVPESLDCTQSTDPSNNLWFYDGLILNFYLNDDGTVDDFGQLI